MPNPFLEKISTAFTRKSPSGGSVVEDTGKKMDQLLVQRATGKGLPSMRQLGYIGKVLTRTDRIILAISGLMMFGALSFIGYDTYTNHVTFVPGNGGEFVETMVGAPHFINPILAPSNDVDADISRLIFSGLFRRDAKMKIVPDLATGYEVSDDKRVYTIHLHDGVEWHDGKPFSADDVVFTLNAIKDRDIGSPLAATFAGVTPAAVDAKTVTLTLDAPFAPLIDSLTVGMLPAHVWSDIAPSAFPFAENNLKKPIGTGPYRIEKYVYDKKGAVLEYHLMRNAKYYGVAPHLDSVTFKFVSDVGAAIDGLNGKQSMALGFVPHEKKGDILSPSIGFVNFDLPRYRAAFFNTQAETPAGDAAVRAALSRATNKQTLVRDALNGDGTIVNGPILPGFLGYNASLAVGYEDLDAAAKLLDDAGWKLSEDGKLRAKTVTVKISKNKTEDKVTPLALTITTIDRPDFAKTAELLKAQWVRLGADVTVRTVGSDTIVRDVLKPRAFDVLVYDIAIGGDPDPYAFWHSSQATDAGLNLSRYANKDIDAMLESARATNEPEARAKLYRDFQDMLVKDVPAIFLMSPKYTYAISTDIKGIETDRIITPSDRFANIENWYITTQRAWK